MRFKKFIEMKLKIKHGDKSLSMLILFGVLLITLVQIILRSIFDIPLVGVEELSRYLFIAFVFMGLSYSFRMDGHIKLEGIGKYFPEKVKKLIEITIDILSVFVFAIISFSAIYTTISNYKSTTPTISIPFWIFFLPTILGFILLTIEHIKKVYKTLKNDLAKWG